MLTTGRTIIGPLAGLILALHSADGAMAAPAIQGAERGPAAIVVANHFQNDWQSDPKRYEATKDDPELKNLPGQLLEKYGIWLVAVGILAFVLNRKK